MNKINLLPWREELRQKRNKLFFFYMGIDVVLSIIVVFSINYYINYRISIDDANVAYINAELQKMSVQTAELQKLDKSKKDILEGINVIQTLQKDRFSAVKLFDTLPHTVPEGVYLTKLSRKSQGAADAGGMASMPVGAPGAAAPGVTSGTEGDAAKKAAAEGKYLITLNGVSVDNAAIAVFLKKLQSVLEFTEVKLQQINASKNGDELSFEIQFIQNIDVKG